MKLQELQTGNKVVLRHGRYVETVMCECAGSVPGGMPGCDKCGSTGFVSATAPAWGPWREQAIYIQRDVPKKGTPQICTLAILDANTAEYDPRRDATMEDVDGEQVLCLQTEDYYLQIKGVEL